MPEVGGYEPGSGAVERAANGAAAGERSGWSDLDRHCTARAGPLSAGAGAS